MSDATRNGEKVVYCGACRTCLDGTWEAAGSKGLPPTASRMVVCVACGNKRCPHATDHRHVCTHSNDTGQAGSVYGTPGARLRPLPARDDA